MLEKKITIAVQILNENIWAARTCSNKFGCKVTLYVLRNLKVSYLIKSKVLEHIIIELRSKNLKVVGKRCSPSAFQSFELFLYIKNNSKNFHALVRATSTHYSIYLLLAYTPILFTTIY